MTTDERVEPAGQAGPDHPDTRDASPARQSPVNRLTNAPTAANWPNVPPNANDSTPAIPTSPAHNTPDNAESDLPWYRRRWAIRAGVALLIGAYIFAWGVTACYTVNPTDLEVFFVPDAQIALTKGFFFIYQLRVSAIYPNANGPLSMAPFTLAAALAQSRGWLSDVYLRRILIFACFAPFPLLVGWEAVRATDRLFATPLRGLARVVAYALFALTPELWHSALFYGHMEQPMEIWFLLAGARLLGDRRVASGGALLALALLTRSVASVACIPLTLLLLRDTLDAGGFQWRRWAGADRAANLRALRHASLTMLRFGGAFCATVALVLAPFLLVDRQDVIFSLVTFRSALPVGGGNLWGLAFMAPWQGIALQYDSSLTLGAALLLSLIVLACRRNLSLRSPDLYGLLTLTSLCFPLLIKMFWPYYLLETYFFAALWVLVSLPTPHAAPSLYGAAKADPATAGASLQVNRDAYDLAGEMGRWGAEQTASPGALGVWGVGWLLPLGVIVTAGLAEYGLSSNSYGGWLAPWPLVVTICLFVLIGATLFWLLWGGAIWRAARWRILREEPEVSMTRWFMAPPPAATSTVHPNHPLAFASETSSFDANQPNQPNHSAEHTQYH